MTNQKHSIDNLQDRAEPLPTQKELTREETNAVMAATAQPTAMEIINRAVQQGTDVSVIEKMFDLYERDEARKAKKSFAAAMSEFQGICPKIPKTKKADRFVYAPLEEIMSKIQPALSKCGLSVRFDTKYHDEVVNDRVFKYITAYCYVSHEAGHVEMSEFTCPVDLDNRTKINVAQQQGSANSYAKRYALSNALNLSFGGEDDDGTAAASKYVTEDQVTHIRDLVEEKKVNKELFFKWAGAESFETVPADKYERIVKEYSQ